MESRSDLGVRRPKLPHSRSLRDGRAPGRMSWSTRHSERRRRRGIWAGVEPPPRFLALSGARNDGGQYFNIGTFETVSLAPLSLAVQPLRLGGDAISPNDVCI